MRVSVRRTPVTSDRQPVEEIEEEAPAPAQRTRPRFPPRRDDGARDELQAAEERAPVINDGAEGELSELVDVVEPVEPVEPVEEQPTGRRRVVSRRRPARTGPNPPQQADPEYYYDY